MATIPSLVTTPEFPDNGPLPIRPFNNGRMGNGPLSGNSGVVTNDGIVATATTTDNDYRQRLPGVWCTTHRRMQIPTDTKIAIRWRHTTHRVRTTYIIAYVPPTSSRTYHLHHRVRTTYIIAYVPPTSSRTYHLHHRAVAVAVAVCSTNCYNTDRLSSTNCYSRRCARNRRTTHSHRTAQ